LAEAPVVIAWGFLFFLEITELPHVKTFGAALAERCASILPGCGKPGYGCPASRASFEKIMKYVEKRFALRIYRRDGTSKLLLGVTGSPPKIGWIREIRMTAREVLKVKMVNYPRRDEPAEALEVL